MEGTNDNKKKIIIFCSIIGVVVILLIATIGVLGANSKSPYVTYFDKATKVIDEVFKKSNKITLNDKKLGINGKVKANLDLKDDLLNDDTKKLQEAINKTEFTYDMKMDQEEKLMQVVISALKDNEELINLDLVAIDDKGYLKIKDVLDEYYKFDLDEAVEFDIDTEELEVIDELEVLYNIAKKEVRKNVLNKRNITTSKDEIKIGGEEINVKKHTLMLTEELAYRTYLAILEDIVNSDEAMEALFKIVNMNSYDKYDDIDDLEEELEDEIERINSKLEDLQEEEDDNSSVGIINVYTKKNKIVKVELGELDDEEFEVEFAIEINEVEKNKFECTLFSFEEKVARITFEKKDKDEYSIEIKNYEDDSKITIDGIIKEDKIDIEYKVVTEDASAKGTLFIENEKDKKFTYKFSIEMDEFGKVAFEIEMNIDNDFKLPDVSNATSNIDETAVQEKLMNKLQDVMDKLGVDLSSLTGLTNSMYNNYDYDDYNFDDYNWDDYDWYDDYDYDDEDYNDDDDYKSNDFEIIDWNDMFND